LSAALDTLGRHGEAEELLTKSIAEAQELVTTFPNMVGARLELALSEMQRGHGHVSHRRLAEATEALQRSADHLETVIRRHAGAVGVAVQAYTQLADVLQKRGQTPQADKACRRAEEILQTHIADFPQTYGRRTGLGKILEGRACRFERLGRLAEMERLYQQALELYEQEARAATTAEQRRDAPLRLAYAWGHLGEYRRRHGRFQPGEEAHRRSLALFEKLCASFPEDADLRNHLARTHNNLAWVLAIRPDRRPDHTADALTHAQKAVDLEPGSHDWWHTLGVAHCRMGHWKEALAAIKKSRQLEHSSSPPSSFGRFFEAMAYSGLGDMQEARRCCDEGVRWMEEHLPHHADLRRFRAEAEQMLKTQKETRKRARSP
jgi:tetratricopeptide (TPR) repeat protein